MKDTSKRYKGDTCPWDTHSRLYHVANNETPGYLLPIKEIGEAF